MMKSYGKLFLSLLLIAAMLVCPVPVSQASSTGSTGKVVVGNLDDDPDINALDALSVLRYNVGLEGFTLVQMSAADVDGNGTIDAVDALSILQYSVGYIKEFDNKSTRVNMDFYYHVTGKDFTDYVSIKDINDGKEVISKLGDAPKAADVDKYEIKDGMLVYNPISTQAKQMGTLNKYDNVKKVTGTIQQGDITVTYSMPTDLTAYDAVPIEYTATAENGRMPVHIEAVAFEESADYDGTNYFDLNIPGNVDVDIKYEGYVNAKLDANKKPILSGKTEDRQGTAYPSYDASELVRSGNLIANPNGISWLKFSFENTGNTILDTDGNGTFCFEPYLYKKNASGGWDQVAITENMFERIFTYMYPGDKGEMWITFRDPYRGYPAGEYRVEIRGLVRHSKGNSPQWQSIIWHGVVATLSSFEFTVTADGAMTEPKKVVKEQTNALSRNGWLRSYEEFMSSFETIPDCIGTTVSGTMYVQPAPWTDTIVLKVTNGPLKEMGCVRIPVNVETDSIHIELNPDNNNYYVKEDGTRTPLIAAQTMADMRSNVQRGPDAASTIINDLTDMKEAGINYLSTTVAFGYDTGSSPASYNTDANKFMLDVARSMGFKIEGYSSYPYNSVGNANNLGAGYFPSQVKGWDNQKIDQANAVMADYTFNRYGDLFWQAYNGIIPITTEDTRGWMRVDLTARYAFGNVTPRNFGAWAEMYYGTIGKLNQAYGNGANYESFLDINIANEATNTTDANYADSFSFYDKSKPFHDWSKAMTEFDLYRTVERANNYRNMLDQVNVPNAKVTVRTEGANWMVAAIDPTTSNQRYRHVYYSQRRAGMVAEIMQASGTIFGHSDYTTLPYYPSEVYELSKKSVEQGVTPVLLPQFNRMRDIAINDLYGEAQYVTEYNLANPNTKGAYISTMVSLFTWWKAAYEGGGVPGALWQDYLCDGIVTQTQYREMKFFREKVEEMLATDEGKNWATHFELPDQSWKEETPGKWSYPKEYIEQTIQTTKRNCIFE